ncbi:MAG: hypothetical protein LBH06_10230 [Rikenellaceae bacterium]|jgi:hypothetical protein|nr:hypothetical protein [Rikenellaceae bacterium]
MKKLLFAAITFALLSCCKEKSELPTPTPGKVWRTYLLYLAGNNTLASSMHIDALELTNGLTDTTLNGGRVLIYYSLSANAAQLIEVQYDPSKGHGVQKVLKTYPAGQSDVDPNVIRQAIVDMTEYAPADSYVIDFSSHALGWTPAVNITGTLAPKRAFGSQYPVGGYPSGAAIDVDMLARTIPDGLPVEAVLFDACAVGCVEVAYEFRNKCRYFGASVAEIPSNGFPYDKIIGYIFDGNAIDWAAFVDTYVEDYPNYNLWHVPTYTIVDCSKLGWLRSVARAAVSAYRPQLMTINLDQAQYYFNRSLIFGYDMGDVLSKVTTGGPLDELVKTTLDEVVVYKRATETSNGSAPAFVQAKFSGLTMHVPQDRFDQATNTVRWNPYYRTLAWYHDVWE